MTYIGRKTFEESRVCKSYKIDELFVNYTYSEENCVVEQTFEQYIQSIVNDMIVGLGNDKNFVYLQNTPSVMWDINHNLNKYASVTVVDSGDTVVIGEVMYLDANNIRLVFSNAFSGKAFIN